METNSKFGLIGKHLQHSRSPQIQKLFGISDYQLHEIPNPDDIPSFLRDTQLSGFNVTIPYKKEIIRYLTELSDLAKETCSVNTVLRTKDGWKGYNTDVCGFEGMLDHYHVSVSGKKCLVIGAGGVSESVRYVLTKRGASTINFLTHAGNTPQSRMLYADAEILIQATPVGMYPQNGDTPLPVSEFPNAEAAVEIIANPLKTEFLLQAEDAGIQYTASGLYMLAAQAKRSAELFLQKQIPDAETERVYGHILTDEQNIVFVGMPGSGKTATAKSLSALLRKPFFDSDDEFTKEFRITPEEYILQNGEQEFRKKETEILQKLTKMTGIILATGGGCVTRKENLHLLRQNGIIVYLQAELNELETCGRPLSAGTGSLQSIYTQRDPIYRSVSDWQIRRGATPEVTAKAICEKLKENGYGKETL